MNDARQQLTDLKRQNPLLRDQMKNEQRGPRGRRHSKAAMATICSMQLCSKKSATMVRTMHG